MMGGVIGATDIRKALAALAERRPVFHREADFQFALAWEIQKHHPDIGVRLEYPVPLEGERGYIDTWLQDSDGAAAIELKYWTRRAELAINGEDFKLKEQSAQDLGRYDLWKDVRRVERLIAGSHAVRGYVLAVSNDQNYWNQGRPGTVDAAFRTHEGRDVSGTLAWSTRASAGTTKSREAPIELQGRYVTRWQPYSRGGAFRYLLLDIGEGLAAAGRA